jgi:hypothetical protein
MKTIEKTKALPLKQIATQFCVALILSLVALLAVAKANTDDNQQSFGYLLRGGQLFYQHTPFSEPIRVYGMDLDSLEIINEYYAKDANAIYCKGNELFDVDYSSFQLAPEPAASSEAGLAMDKHSLIEAFGCQRLEYNEEDHINHNSITIIEIMSNEDSNPWNNNHFHLNDQENLYSLFCGKGGCSPIKVRAKNQTTGLFSDDIDAATFEIINAHYAKDKNRVYHYYQSIPSQTITHYNILNGADPDTFEALANDYAIDNGVIYKAGVTLTGVEDPSTFKSFENNHSLSKDKDNIYYLHGSIWYDSDTSMIKLTDIDPVVFGIIDQPTFTVLDRAYSKDKNNVYYNLCGKGGCDIYIIEGADPDTFEIIENDKLYNDLAKDKNNIYEYGKVIPGFDTATFRVIYADLPVVEPIVGDSQKIVNLWTGLEIKAIQDPANLKAVEDESSIAFLKDDYHVYDLDGDIISNDPQNYRHIGDYLSVDSENAYCNGKKIVDVVNPSSLEKVSDNYAKDENYVYYLSEYLHINYVFEDQADGNMNDICPGFITGADPQTFEVLSDIYAKDQNNVYYKNSILKGADPNTFYTNFAYNDYYDGRDIDSFFRADNDLINSEADISELKSYFPDILNANYRNSIQKLADHNIVNGYPDGTYGPDELINRAEFTKIVVGAFYKENLIPQELFENCFDDVGIQWFSKFVCFASYKDIVQGYVNAGNIFKPEQNVNYVEALKIIYKTADDPGKLNPSNQEWFGSYYEDAVENGIHLAELDGQYSHLLTRAEMAELITRYLENK